MTISPPTVVRCPRCPTIFTLEYPMSYTTFVSEYWSDGWADQSGVEGTAPVFYCRRCRQWRWIGDTVHLFEMPYSIASAALPQLTTFDYLTVDQLTSALEQDWPKDRELHLRRQLLWLQNHPRRGSGDGAAVSAELMDNLERLAELVDPSEEPLFLAEIHRELGEFEAAGNLVASWLAVVSPEDGASGEDGNAGFVPLAELLQERISAQAIAPFEWTPADDAGESGSGSPRSAMCDVRDAYENGLALFPPFEDVFAFPDDAARAAERPILSVRLDGIDSRWGDWATIFGVTECRSTLRFGRIFRQDEWAQYEAASDAWKRELQWFWSKRSTDFQLDGTSDEADRYFRMLYYLKYGLWAYHEGIPLAGEEDRSDFDSLYDDPTLEGDYHRLYWMHHWGVIGSAIDTDAAFDPHIVSMLRDEYRSAQQDADERRLSAVGGLKYLETDGPSWFQGLDQTPVVDGRRCEFVAQIWLDYINAGFSLVYLFYDPVTGTVAQTYDYD